MATKVPGVLLHQPLENSDEGEHLQLLIHYIHMDHFDQLVKTGQTNFFKYLVQSDSFLVEHFHFWSGSADVYIDFVLEVTCAQGFNAHI